MKRKCTVKSPIITPHGTLRADAVRPPQGVSAPRCHPGTHQGSVVNLLSRVAADVPNLFLCDVFYWSNYMWEGHGPRAPTSGHVVILNKNRELSFFPALCIPKSQDASFETFHRTFNLGNLSCVWKKGAGPKFTVRITSQKYKNNSYNIEKLKNLTLVC